MTNKSPLTPTGHKEVLEKAIQKAIDGGWKDPFGITQFNMKIGLGDNEWGVAHTALTVRLPSNVTKRYEDNYYSYEMFIFNHDFTKALWGEENYDALPDKIDGEWKWNKFPLEPYWSAYADDRGYDAPVWQYHLQQMVIAEDPIKYLGDNI